MEKAIDTIYRLLNGKATKTSTLLPVLLFESLCLERRLNLNRKLFVVLPLLYPPSVNTDRRLLPVLPLPACSTSFIDDRALA